MFRNGGDRVYFDTRPDFYLEPWRTLTRFYSAWTATPYLGSPNYHTGAITSVAPLAALSALGLTPSAVFRTWHFVLLALAAWGTIRLTRHLLPGLSPYAALFAGAVYVANPWAIDGASVLPIALSLALLPWQVLLLLKSLEAPRSWRWPAFFGFTFFAMAGSNAAVQPLFGLVAVPVVAVYARLALALRWRDIAAAVGKCALFVVVLSAYWLPATFAAGRAGSDLVDTTETLEGIAGTSSFAEVLRGLGFWPLYGGDADGPWIAAHTSYVDSWPVVVATFAAAGLALLSLLAVRTRVRRLLIALVVVAVVLMVGVYPYSSPSPFGRALRWTFDNVPLLILFRTTNKVGEVLVLALAVASAAGVAWLLTRVGRRWLTVPLLLIVLIGMSFPAWQGKLYASEWPIPDYWKEAGHTLDKGPPDQRTLVMPGYVTATYRWRGSGRPDELLYGLTKRNVVVPSTVQNTTSAAYNFMSALDDTFQSRTGPSSSLSAFARLLGAQQVLVRHDWDWETVGGIRPSEVGAEITADNGLEPIRNFGKPGEDVQGPGQKPDGFFEKFVPPLQLYGVTDAPAMVRAEPLESAAVVAGDGWAVPAMEQAGVLREGAPFRYAQDLAPREFASLLGPSHQIVVTDTNRRRTIIPGTVTHGNGRLLAADEPMTGGTPHPGHGRGRPDGAVDRSRPRHRGPQRDDPRAAPWVEPGQRPGRQRLHGVAGWQGKLRARQHPHAPATFAPPARRRHDQPAASRRSVRPVGRGQRRRREAPGRPLLGACQGRLRGSRHRQAQHQGRLAGRDRRQRRRAVRGVHPRADGHARGEAADHRRRSVRQAHLRRAGAIPPDATADPVDARTGGGGRRRRGQPEPCVHHLHRSRVPRAGGGAHRHVARGPPGPGRGCPHRREVQQRVPGQSRPPSLPGLRR